MSWRGLLLLTCVFAVAPIAAAQEADRVGNAVRAILDDQVAAWNDRDLVRFMKGYWEDEKLSFFSGNAKTSGWKATLERYRKKYQGEGKEMGKLSFKELTIELLGDDHALVRGRFHLECLPRYFPTGSQSAS